MDSEETLISECPICFEDKNDEIQITSCGHAFHAKCVRNLNLCPLCRTPLGVDIRSEPKFLKFINLLTCVAGLVGIGFLFYTLETMDTTPTMEPTQVVA